jgi:hypothetical protein
MDAPGKPGPSDPEVMDDGQEEVFSHTAIERGLVKDPLALDPAAFGERPPGCDEPPGG